MTFTVETRTIHDETIAVLGADPVTVRYRYVQYDNDGLWHPCTAIGEPVVLACIKYKTEQGTVLHDGLLGIDGLTTCPRCSTFHHDRISDAAQLRKLIVAVRAVTDPAASLSDLLDATSALLESSDWFSPIEFIDRDALTQIHRRWSAVGRARLDEHRRRDPQLGARCAAAAFWYLDADDFAARGDRRPQPPTTMGDDSCHDVVTRVWPTQPDQTMVELGYDNVPDEVAAEIVERLQVRTAEHLASEADGLVALSTTLSGLVDAVVGYPFLWDRLLVAAVPASVAAQLTDSWMGHVQVLGDTDLDRFDRTARVYLDLAAARDDVDHVELWAAAQRIS